MSDGREQYVLFRVGGEEYGLPISCVSSIIRYGAVTPVPRAPRAVKGVIDLRGRVVPVVDLGKRLFDTGIEPGPRSRIVVTEGDGGEVGLAVDSASEVATFAQDELMQTPTSILAPEIADAFHAVVHLGDRLIVLLDLDRILPRAEYALPGADVAEGD